MRLYGVDPAYALESTILFGISLGFWILGLFIISLILFYELLVRYLLQKDRIHRFKMTLIDILSHKLGNFIVTQKVNLSILKENFDPLVIERTLKSLKAIEEDYKKILESIEAFNPEHLRREIFDLSSVVEKIVDDVKGRVSFDGNVVMRISPTFVFANRLESSIFLSLILENAFKYAHQKIYIRTGLFRKNPYFVVVNDIKPELPTSGVGIGLIIAKNVAVNLGLKRLSIEKRDKNHFVITLWQRKR